jgi:hypothetical protein
LSLSPASLGGDIGGDFPEFASTASRQLRRA